MDNTQTYLQIHDEINRDIYLLTGHDEVEPAGENLVLRVVHLASLPQILHKAVLGGVE